MGSIKVGENIAIYPRLARLRMMVFWVGLDLRRISGPGRGLMGEERRIMVR